MTPEQKARLARIELRVNPCDIEDDIDGDPSVWADCAWLFALVKELDEENARQRQDVAEAEASMRESERNAAHAEQQLAIVTAERECVVAALTAAHDTIQVLGRERDELKRIADIRYDILRVRAEKAEAERDALRATLAEAEWLIEHAPAATLGEPDEMAWLNREAAWSRARELARLKGGG